MLTTKTIEAPRRFAAAVTAAAACTFAPVASADGVDLLPFALSGGTPNVDLRLRYEEVELKPVYGAGVTEDAATAYTLRARLGYTTGKWNDLDAQLELESVSHLGDEDFQSTENLAAAFPVIADPEGGEVNQAWLRYSGLPKTALKLGRQRLVYDNARFVGNVGWRQNEQTYDGLSLASSWLPKTTVNAAYLRNVNAFRSFRMDPANAAAPCSTAFACSDDLDLDARMLNVAIAAFKPLTVSAYVYQLDFAFDTAARRDTQTLGLRLGGSAPYRALKFSYTAEYADQQDHADAPDTVDAGYRLIEAGVAYRKLSARLGYEVLGGDGVYGFQTPLATLHAFQGWADLFLATPNTGVRDLYAQLGGSVGKLALTAVWHGYEADHGATSYGDEVDLQAVYPITEQFGFGVKVAAYSGDDQAPAVALKADTTKTWAWLEYKF